MLPGRKLPKTHFRLTGLIWFSCICLFILRAWLSVSLLFLFVSGLAAAYNCGTPRTFLFFSSSMVSTFITEPPNNKTNKTTVRPAKIQISLGIRPVWSASSLCVQWVAEDPSFLHADSAHAICWFCHEAAHILTVWHEMFVLYNDAIISSFRIVQIKANGQFYHCFSSLINRTKVWINN